MESFQFYYWPVGDPSPKLPGRRASCRGSRWPEAREGTPPGGAGRWVELGARRRGCPGDSAGGGTRGERARLDASPARRPPEPGSGASAPRRLSAGSGRAKRRGARARGGRRRGAQGSTFPGAPHARADRRGRRRRLSASPPGCRRGDGHGSRPWPCPRPCRSLSAPRAHERPGQCDFDASRRSGTWRGEQRALELVPGLPRGSTLTPRCRGQRGGAPSPGLCGPPCRKLYCTVVCGTALFGAEDGRRAAASLCPGKHQLPT